MNLDQSKLKLRKTGQVYIPSYVRKTVNFKLGEYIKVLIEGETIVLTNQEGYDEENKCVLGQKGTVSIPAEIRRIRRIDEHTIFRMILDLKEQRICLLPE